MVLLFWSKMSLGVVSLFDLKCPLELSRYLSKTSPLQMGVVSIFDLKCSLYRWKLFRYFDLKRSLESSRHLTKTSPHRSASSPTDCLPAAPTTRLPSTLPSGPTDAGCWTACALRNNNLENNSLRINSLRNDNLKNNSLRGYRRWVLDSLRP